MNIKIITFGIMALLSLSSCHFGHDHNHEGHDHSGHDHSSHDHSGHDHGETGHSEEINNDKTVFLNQAQVKNAGIILGKAEKRNINDVVVANGYTELDPQHEADVAIPVSGIIQNVFVIEGNHVKKGSVLATMNSIEATDIKLKLSDITKEIEIIEAELLYLNKEFKRQSKLAEESVNALKVLEKVESELSIKNSSLSNYQTQKTLLNASLNSLNFNKEGTINILAPISGYITELGIKIGTAVTPGQSLVHIVNNNEMHLDLLVYENDLPKIKEGQQVRFKLTNQSSSEIIAEIYNIGKSFANDTKSVAVHAEIGPTNENLIPGMYVNALIDIGNSKVQTLPEESIIMAEEKKYIFVTKDKVDAQEMQFDRIEIATGAEKLGFTEITLLEKINPDQLIVLNGAYYVQSHLLKAASGGGHGHAH